MNECPISNDLCEHTHNLDLILCAECGGNLNAEPTIIIVDNTMTDRTGYVHLSCFEAHDDVLTEVSRFPSKGPK